MKWSKQICSKIVFAEQTMPLLQKEKPHPKQLLHTLGMRERRKLISKVRNFAKHQRIPEDLSFFFLKSSCLDIALCFAFLLSCQLPSPSQFLFIWLFLLLFVELWFLLVCFKSFHFYSKEIFAKGFKAGISPEARRKGGGAGRAVQCWMPLKTFLHSPYHGF